MKYLFLLLVVSLFSCFQEQSTIKPLYPSKEKTPLNRSFIKDMYMANCNCGSTHRFKFVNDSTTASFFYRNRNAEEMIRLSDVQLELWSEFWNIDGITDPTKNNLIQILKDYKVELKDFEITQTDSLQFEIRNRINNDQFGAYFTLDKLEYHELNEKEKSDFFENSKNKVYRCVSGENNGKYALQINYLKQDKKDQFLIDTLMIN